MDMINMGSKQRRMQILAVFMKFSSKMESRIYEVFIEDGVFVCNIISSISANLVNL